MANKELHLLKTLTGHSGAIYDVVAHNGYVYTSSADKFVVRWNLSTGEQDNFTVKLEHVAFNIAVDDKGDKLVIGNRKGGLHVVDIESKVEEKYLTQHKAPIFSLTYNAHKGVFYSGDDDGYFCVWEAGSMKLLITLPLNCGKIRQISINEDGEFLAVCGQDGKLRIFETQFYNEIECISINTAGVNTAQFMGDKIIVGGKDALLSIWNWKKKALIQSVPAHNYAIYDLSLLDNEKDLISVSFDKSIKRWQLPSLEIIQRIEFKNQGHRHTVNRISKVDENTFVTVSDDALIKVWQIR